MERPARRSRPAWRILVGLLFCGAFCAEDAARAQTSAPEKGQSKDRNGTAKAQPRTDRRGAGVPGDRVQDPGRAQVQPRNEPSEAYRESLRRTIEMRRQRRARLGQQQGLGTAPTPVGAIVAWPMPPALIIRHTPRVHDEIDAFLGALRR